MSRGEQKWNKDEKLQILGDHIAENFQNETNLSQFTFFFEPSSVRSSDDSLIVTFFFVFSFLSEKKFQGCSPKIRNKFQ